MHQLPDKICYKKTTPEDDRSKISGYTNVYRHTQKKKPHTCILSTQLRSESKPLKILKICYKL